MGAGGIMTPEEIQARSEKATKLYEKMVQWLENQHVETDVAAIAVIHTAAAFIAITFGDPAGNDFLRMINQFIEDRVPQEWASAQSPEDKKFWNLVAEKDYDLPADIRTEQEKAEDGDPMLKLKRLAKEGKITPAMDREMLALAKKFGGSPKKKAKAARRNG
jgi:hypothetical protein